MGERARLSTSSGLPTSHQHVYAGGSAILPHAVRRQAPPIGEPGLTGVAKEWRNTLLRRADGIGGRR